LRGEPSAESVTAQIEAGLQEACGAKVRIGEAVGVVKRVLTHRDLSLHLYRVSGGGPARARPPYLEVRWTEAEEAADLGISTAMQRAIEMAHQEL
jgi:A/G-specific adenine glycosylase